MIRLLLGVLNSVSIVVLSFLIKLIVGVLNRVSVVVFSF